MRIVTGKQMIRSLLITATSWVAAQLLLTCPCCQAQVIVPVNGDFGVVASMVSSRGEMWIGSEKGVFRVDETTNQVSPVRGDVGVVISKLIVSDNEILAGGFTNGAFRINPKSNEAVRIEGDYTGAIRTILKVNGDIWFGGTNGAFRVPSGSKKAVPLVGNPGHVDFIDFEDGEIWVGATNGTFRADRRSNRLVPVANTGYALSISFHKGEVWLGCEHGAFRIDPKTRNAIAIRGATGRVHVIISVQDEIWLGAENGTFRVNRKTDEAEPIEGTSGPVYKMLQLGNRVWLAGTKGVYWVDPIDDKATLVRGDVGFVYLLVPVGDELWFGGTQGTFRVRKPDEQVVPVGGDIGQSSEIVCESGDVWLSGSKGAYRLDRNTVINTDLKGSLPFVGHLFNTSLWLEGDTLPVIRYANRSSGVSEYDSRLPAPIRVVYDSDLVNLKAKLKSGRGWTDVTQDGPIISLKPWKAEIYIAVWDGWGNKENDTQIHRIKGWVLPAKSLTLLVPLFGAASLCCCLLLAPYVRYCHLLLMNPFLRNWLSFGTVPLLLTAVPPLRRHIFKRYLKGLSKESTLASLARRYVVPEEKFSPTLFAETLQRHRIIGIHGQSGIGKTAFLMFLAFQYATNKRLYPNADQLIPIFLDLSLAGDTPLESLIRSQLRKHGDLTDDNLTDVFLNHGGFLFLFDGLNELNEPVMKKIIHFADMHRQHSCSCVSTQVATEDLKRISRLMESGELSNPKIIELVESFAGSEDPRYCSFDARDVLVLFTEETYKICRVPFQLELLLEMWATSERIPTNLDDLYSYVLGPMVDKRTWTAKGHGDYPDVLSRLAFTMMIEKRVHFPARDYLPAELETELLEKKLLVDRGDVQEFRHDRVRAYLAARYFHQHWRSILMDANTVIDSNWGPMLEFSLANEESVERAKDLVFLLVNQDMEIAIRLNAWGTQNKNDLFGIWQDEFSLEIGRRIVNEMHIRTS